MGGGQAAGRARGGEGVIPAGSLLVLALSYLRSGFTTHADPREGRMRVRTMTRIDGGWTHNLEPSPRCRHGNAAPGNGVGAFFAARLPDACLGKRAAIRRWTSGPRGKPQR